jgi:hypothetical protein
MSFSPLAAQLPDITVHDHGTVLLLHATSRRGRAWVDANVSDDRQEWAGAVVVEHRYIGDIVAGAVADGRRVRS